MDSEKLNRGFLHLRDLHRCRLIEREGRAGRLAKGSSDEEIPGRAAPLFGRPRSGEFYVDSHILEIQRTKK
jgi:hypothetical protein